MRYTYRNRKIKILIEILKETILVKVSDKYGVIMQSISENQNEYEQDLKDLIEICPTRSAKKWVKNINWDTVKLIRYNMADVEFTLTMFTVAKHPGKLKAIFN